MRIAASTPDLIFYRWILKPKRTIELTCTLSGNWNVDPESVYCLSSTEVNEYEIRNEVAIEALPFEVSVEISESKLSQYNEYGTKIALKGKI